MTLPLVTVVMNTLDDDPRDFRAALDSCLSQMGVDVWLIVSTVEGDPSVDVALAAGAEVVVGLAGGCAQINRALHLVRGDWFCFMSGDDIMLPDRLARATEPYLQWGNTIVPAGGVLYNDYYEVDLRDRTSRIVELPPVYDYKLHLQRNFVPDVSVMAMWVLEKHGPFREEWGNRAFWDFWLRVAEDEGPGIFTHSARPDWIYYVRETSQHVRRKADAAWTSRESELTQRMLRSHGHGEG